MNQETCPSSCAAQHAGREHEEIESVRSQALRDAADSLELMPPLVRSQYVATLRLYADQPWRLKAAFKGGGA